MDDLTHLLQIEGVSTVGVLLTGFVFFVLALWKEWLVTGRRWQDKVGECGQLSEALKMAQSELKAVERDDTEARIDLARLEVEQAHGWDQTPGPRKRTRP